jgi:hypothetical protein
MDKANYIKVIDLAKDPNAYLYYDEIMEAYEKLDQMGSHEMKDLKIKFLHGKLTSPMKEIFENYIAEHDECLQDLLKLKEIYNVLKNYHTKAEEMIPEHIDFITLLKNNIVFNQNESNMGSRSIFQLSSFEILAKDHGLEKTVIEKIRKALLSTINNLKNTSIPFKDFLAFLKKEFEKNLVDLKYFDTTRKIILNIINKSAKSSKK